MNAASPPRDDRVVAVENASYRWAYLTLSLGLLASVAYRAFALRESSWDLLSLVIFGGVVSVLYRGRHGALSGRSALAPLLALGVALLLGAALALIVR
jgi:hypothetical protein